MGAGRSSLRGAVAACGLALAAVTLSLLAAEVVARLSWSDEPRPTGTGHRHRTDDPALDGLPVLWTPFDLAKPNVRGVHVGVLHRTNSAGVRGPEFAAQAPPGTFRILLAGDSIAMGHGVLEQERYSAVTERLLQTSATPGVRFQFVNVGLSGLNVDQIVSRVERVGLAYHPDLFVYGFTVNDIEGIGYEPASDAEREAFYDEMARFTHSPSYLLRLVWPRAVVAWSSLHPMVGSYERVLVENYFHNPRASGRILGGFDTLAALTQRRHICAVLFVHPVVHQLSVLHPFKRIYDYVGKQAALRGFEVVQGFPALAGRDTAKLRFNLVDTHPNPEAHRLLGRALYDGLRALPARCGVSAGQR